MIRTTTIVSAVLALAGTGAAQYVVLETTQGRITLDLDAEAAPISVENFLAYMDDGAYDGTVFHRVIPGFVIQAGGFEPDMTKRPTREPIANEWQNGLKNVTGSVAMARLGGQPDSATNQFFINVADNNALDRAQADGAGYAVFGEVVSGMDIAMRISAVRTSTRAVEGVAGAYSNVPEEPIVINSARLATDDEIAAVEAERVRLEQEERIRRVEEARDEIRPALEFVEREFDLDTARGAVTDSGLFVLDVSEGTGANPQANEPVAMDIDMWTEQGVVVLSSDNNPFGEPTRFTPAAPAMDGFLEALTTMNIGGERWAIIPPALAFGAQGRGNITPNSAVIVRVELLSPERLAEVEEAAKAERDQFASSLVALAKSTASDYLGYDIEGGEDRESGAFVKVLEAPEPDAEPVDPAQPWPVRYTVWSGLGWQAFDSTGGPGFNRAPLGQIFPASGAIDDARPGEKRLIILPSEVAFGDRGNSVIPPYTSVIMELEVLTEEEAERVTQAHIDESFEQALTFLADELQVPISGGARHESGLWSVVSAEGDGPSPTVDDMVRVHYVGYLPDGSIFDSSRERGQPASFPLSGVVEGWRIGLPLMQQGETRYLIIPPDLGYGERGAPPRIPPHSTLIFETELLEVISADSADSGDETPTEQEDAMTE